MAQFGSGGSGGTIEQAIQPFYPNPKQFVFLNGNSGVTGVSSGTGTTTSTTNANVGIGGSGAGATGYVGYGGGAGGAGAYIKVVYNGGQIPPGTIINFNLGDKGSGGSGGGGNGVVGGIRITWT